MTQEKTDRNRVIVERYKEGLSMYKLARIYEMSQVSIFRIIKRWRKKYG